MKLVRFGVSMEENLLEQFDYSIDRKGYANRSEALRDLVRNCLVEQDKEDPKASAVAVITFVYDHEKRELARDLTQLGHSHLTEIISTLHVHLTEHNCLEIVVAKGMVGELRNLTDRILSNRGVLHGELVLIPNP